MDFLPSLFSDLLTEQPLLVGAAMAVATFASVLAIHRLIVLSRRPTTVLPLEDFIAVPLIDKKIMSHDTRRFTFQLPNDNDILGLPIGQHLSLQYTDSKTQKSIQRSYTPVSCDTVPGKFSLVVKVYPPLAPKFPLGGLMSQHLDRLNIGDTINMRGPKGHLHYHHYGKFTVKPLGKPKQRRSCQNIVMLAGGTGITPMYQVLTAILTSPHASKNNNIRSIKLLYANQTPDDVLLRDQLDTLAKQFPDRFSVWYTVDRVTQEYERTWKYSKGFITKQMVEEHCWFGDVQEQKTQVFMCGPPPMIKFACLPALKELGCTENHWVVF